MIPGDPAFLPAKEPFMETVGIEPTRSSRRGQLPHLPAFPLQIRWIEQIAKAWMRVWYEEYRVTRGDG